MSIDKAIEHIDLIGTLIDELEDVIADTHDIDVTDRSYAIAIADHLVAKGYLRPIPETHVLVPREPTEEMRKAWNCESDSYFNSRAYTAMIAAQEDENG